jgi:hypothetical protein
MGRAGKLDAAESRKQGRPTSPELQNPSDDMRKKIKGTKASFISGERENNPAQRRKLLPEAVFGRFVGPSQQK